MQQVQHRVQPPPRLHVFGHIHEGYGYSFDGHTLYVNASNLDLSYIPVNPCIVVDLPHDQSQPAMIVHPQCPIQNASQLETWLNTRTWRRLHLRSAPLAAAVQESGEEQRLLLPKGNALLQESAFLQILRCSSVASRSGGAKAFATSLGGTLCSVLCPRPTAMKKLEMGEVIHTIKLHNTQQASVLLDLVDFRFSRFPKLDEKARMLRSVS